MSTTCFLKNKMYSEAPEWAQALVQECMGKNKINEKKDSADNKYYGDETKKLANDLKEHKQKEKGNKKKNSDDGWRI